MPEPSEPVQSVPQATVFARPLEMPIRCLLALPERRPPTRPDAPFNFPLMIARLLGASGSWSNATAAIDVRVWAPSWQAADLRAFLDGPLLDGGWPFPRPSVGQIRSRRFIGGDRGSAPAFDIVHVAGSIAAGPSLVLEGQPRRTPTWLKDALVAESARLLTLEVRPDDRERAAALARLIVALGGPPALVVDDADPEARDAFLFDFYAGIAHRQPLEALAHSLVGRHPFEFFFGRGGENPFSFDYVIGDLTARARVATARLAPVRGALVEGSPLLHEAQRRGLERVFRDRLGQQPPWTIEERLDELQTYPWDHERDGLIPLGEAARSARRFPTTAIGSGRAQAALRRRLQAELAKAPRVLNANFRDSRGELLPSDQGLIAGQAYDLLVDIGPRWDKHLSLVRGNDAFPEAALPPGREGYTIEAVLVSEAFEPSIIRAQLWVPRDSGRSHPVTDGRADPIPGPVALRVSAPTIRDEAERPLRGRLHLYHENNLIQSAVVKATVVTSGQTQPQRPNAITVDYALSHGLRDLASYRTRRLRFRPDGPRQAHPVALSLTVNDDGGGGHRVAMRLEDGLGAEFGVVRYDASKVGKLLERARTELFGCFHRREASGQPDLGQPISALNRTRQQLREDLFTLALIGDELRQHLVHAVRPADLRRYGPGPLAWERQLRQALKGAGVVQVATTGQVGAAYPWALVYMIPMPGPNSASYRYCKVIDEEWNADGQRNGPPLERCPHEDEADHDQNTICPYGFWGFKHLVEQPAQAIVEATEVVPLEATSVIPTPARVPLALAVTQDIDAAVLGQHLTAIQGLALLSSVGNPAQDVDTLLQRWGANGGSIPALVYFLCHGEQDVRAGSPYLGIGPRDLAREHCLYPKQLQGWAYAERPPNLDGWQTGRPLVIINGCETAAFDPSEVFEFVSAFAYAGASGVIGTETKVLTSLARKVGEGLLGRLAGGKRLGEAMREVRWELLNQGNVLGLTYTPFGLSDLHIERRPR